jgi:hypothetical protein
MSHVSLPLHFTLYEALLMSETLTPLERRALFKAAVTLHQITMAQAAQRLGVSYNHLMLVLAGERVGSRRLQERIAAFVDRPRDQLFASPHTDRMGFIRCGPQS